MKKEREKSVVEHDPYGLPMDLDSKSLNKNTGILSTTKDLLSRVMLIKTMFSGVGTGNRTGKKTRKF